jgi:hypothetical protein
MTRRKVRAGQTFIFCPVMLDKLHPPHYVREGDTVRVVNLRGCPRANTMGHAHVQHLDGTFAGLVCTNSLLSRAEYMEYVRRRIAEHEARERATERNL